MEVSGRKMFNEEDNLLCKPCEERGLATRAEGLCRQCDELVCRPCFDTHKQWKINRGHTMANPDEAVTTRDETENSVKCDEHSGELIKFYCPQHEQVGCGDCMILEHKSCKVEYIRDKARTFKGSQEFRDLIKGAEKVQLEAKQVMSSIKDNKVQVSDINEKFIRDINVFKDEMISHINKLTNAMLKQGEYIKATNKSLDEIENENEILMNEISRLTQLLESQTDQPQKLFVSSISEKPKLNRLRGRLDNIKGKNKIEMYEFIRDVNLEHSVKDVKNLGSLQKMKPRKETDEQEEVRPKKTSQVPQVPEPPKPQPLLDRQLICRNITVDGEYLSYADNGSGDVGLFVDRNKMVIGSYFEVEILNMGQRGTIAIGLVPKNYPENKQPGCGTYSIGYHAGDGKFYNKSGSGVSFGPKCNAGDRIGCGIIKYMFFDNKVVFTRNGKKIGVKGISCRERLYLAVGMHSAGEKVKVILDAKMPRM